MYFMFSIFSHYLLQISAKHFIGSKTIEFVTEVTFKNHRNFSEKKKKIVNSLKELSFYRTCHTIYHKKPFRNHLYHDMITYPSPSKIIHHSYIEFHCFIALSVMTSHTPILLSRIHLFLIFQFIIFPFE
jgi:hypothetical protein